MSLTGSGVSVGPIEAVTFDLYDTLVELVPRRWDRLESALRTLGIEADVDALRVADVAAEDFFTIENGRMPIRDRPAAEREAFRLQYMQVWLEAAGIETDELLVRNARRRYLAEFETPAAEAGPYGGYRVFNDVVPALQRLRGAGVKRAVISNADDDVTDFCTHLAFAHEMNLIVTSAIVGYEKPDARTFYAALDPLQVEPAHTLHIGDQPKSDVVGALAVGMQAALIDRYDRHDPEGHDVPVFAGLDALVDYVLEINASAKASAT
ncbi:MAG: HAD family hydrolase [Thermomicrobiales bacterium]